MRLEILTTKEPSTDERRSYGPGEERDPGHNETESTADKPLEDRARIAEEGGDVEVEEKHEAGEIDRVRDHQREQRALEWIVGELHGGQEHERVIDDGECEPDTKRCREAADAILDAVRDDRR